jgi:hypothetical protein
MVSAGILALQIGATSKIRTALKQVRENGPNQAEQTGKLFPVSRFDDEIVGNSEAGQAAKRLKKRLT